MAETRKGWDPNKLYDASVAERASMEERNRIRLRLKTEWQKKVNNPFRGVGGSIVSKAAYCQQRNDSGIDEAIQHQCS